MLELPPHAVLVKLSIDGQTSAPFSAVAFEPLPVVGLAKKIIAWSRETYGNKKKDVEEEIRKSLRLASARKKAATDIETLKNFREKLDKIVTVPQNFEPEPVPQKEPIKEEAPQGAPIAFNKSVSEIKSEKEEAILEEEASYQELAPGEEAVF